MALRWFERGDGDTQAGEERHPEVYFSSSAVNHHTHADNFGTSLSNGTEHFSDAAAGGEHVIHDEHPVPWAYFEAATEFALVLGTFLAFGNDARQREVAGSFIRKDDPAGRRPGNDCGLAPEVFGDLPTEFTGQIRPLQDAELLDVGVAVAPAGELEVSAGGA